MLGLAMFGRRGVDGYDCVCCVMVSCDEAGVVCYVVV